jgi:hypothetical protein
MKEKLEILNEIKLSALFLKHNRDSEHAGEAVLVQADIDDLVEEFHAGCGDFLSGEQYEKAKKDFDFFLMLLDLALEHYSRRAEKKT